MAGNEGNGGISETFPAGQGNRDRPPFDPMALNLVFSSGERLGWQFQDRRTLVRPFREPKPVAEKPDFDVYRRLQQAPRPGGTSGAAVVILILSALLEGGLFLAFVNGVLHERTVSAVIGDVFGLIILTDLVGGVGAAAGLWIVWVPGRHLRRARRNWDRAVATAAARSDAAQRAWEAKRDEHIRGELVRLANVPEWEMVRSRRHSLHVDVFGGTVVTLRHFTTTLGASLVATSPPLRIVDLSQRDVSRQLCEMGRRRGLSVQVDVLPRDLATRDLLAGLHNEEVVDLLVESFVREGASTQEGPDRATDSLVLNELCARLDGNLSMARIHEALVALMGQPVRPTHLTRAEWDGITDGLFSAEFVRDSYSRLRVLQAYLHPFRYMGGEDAVPVLLAGQIRCLVIGGGQLLAADLLEELLTQRLIRTLRQDAERNERGALMVIGADRLKRRHLRRLSDISESLGVKITCFFDTLTDEGASMLGRGATVLLRLPAADEARRAAEFIGRGHRFELGQVTLTRGVGETGSLSEGDSRTLTVTRGWFGTLNESPVEGHTGQASMQRSISADQQASVTGQRTYEYLVEPTVLQNLADYGFLLVERGIGCPSLPASYPQVRAGDCNLAIFSLPEVLSDPRFAAAARSDEPDSPPTTYPSPPA